MLSQETIDGHSEYGDDARSLHSAMSTMDVHSLGDLSPNAL